MASRPSKKRRLTPPPSDEDGSKAQKAFFKSASRWHLEQDYESRPRKGKKSKESTRLPIRTADGRIEQLHVQEGDAASVDSDAEWLENDGDDDVSVEEEPKKVPEAPKIPEREQIRHAQE